MFRRHAVHQRERQFRAEQQLVIRCVLDDHAHVVELAGDLDVTSARVLEDELKRVERSDSLEIVVDLSGLRYIDSAGVRALIHADARSRRSGRSLMLVAGDEHVQRVFETTGLATRLPFAA